jgi:hypothetical protein
MLEVPDIVGQGIRLVNSLSTASRLLRVGVANVQGLNLSLDQLNRETLELLLLDQQFEFIDLNPRPLTPGEQMLLLLDGEAENFPGVVVDLNRPDLLGVELFVYAQTEAGDALAGTYGLLGRPLITGVAVPESRTAFLLISGAAILLIAPRIARRRQLPNYVCCGSGFGIRRKLNSHCAILMLVTNTALASAVRESVAAPLEVASYEMFNGDGFASGGMFNYWDVNYTGAGSTNVDGAPLSGGVGDLTDNIIAPDNWFTVENLTGTGPYVGWRAAVTPNPLVTFRFATPVFLDSITIYVDDSNGVGGVSPPESIDIGLEGGPYTNFPTTDPPGSAPLAFTFTGLGLTGSAVDLRFNNRNEYIFVSQVTFNGRAVPEPASIVIGVLAVIVPVRTRRRSHRNVRYLPLKLNRIGRFDRRR